MKTEIKREPVESSNIASIGYSSGIKTLEIEFHGGSVYRFHPITPEGYRLFRESESLGGFFHKHIRNNPMVKTTKVQ